MLNRHCKCGLISVLFNAFLLAIPILFIIAKVKKVEIPDPNKLMVDQEKVSQIMDCMYNCINHALHCMRNIFLFSDKGKSYRALGGLVITYFVSRRMSDVTIIWIVIDALFAVSFVAWIRPQSKEEIKEVANKVKLFASGVFNKIPQSKEKND